MKRLCIVLLVLGGCDGAVEDPEAEGDVESRLTTLEATTSSQALQLEALEADISALEPASANHCFWAWSSCNAPVGTECQVACDDYDDEFGDTNDYWVAGGGCDLTAGASMLENRAARFGGDGFPPEVSEKAFNGWVCQAAGGAVQTGYAHCCR